MEGPVKPVVRKLRAEKQDPKRSASAKRQTLERKKTRELKRVRRIGADLEPRS